MCSHLWNSYYYYGLLTDFLYYLATYILDYFLIAWNFIYLDLHSCGSTEFHGLSLDLLYSYLLGA